MKANDMPKNQTSFWQRLGLILGGIWLAAVILEIGLRIAGGLLYLGQESRNMASVYKKGTYRILCIGESTTAGGQYAWPAQLEKALNARNIGITFSVINKGIGGADTYHLASQLESNIQTYHPDMVIAMMGVNDRDDYVFQRHKSGFGFQDFLQSLKIHRLWKVVWASTKVPTAADSLTEAKFDRIAAWIQRGHLSAEKQFSPDELERLQEYSAGLEASFAAGNDERTRYYFDRLLELWPENDWLYSLLGRFDDEHQESWLKQAIHMNAKNDDAHFSLGIFYTHEKRYDEAKEEFKRAVDINPENDEACMGLGWAYLRENNFSEAISLFRKSIILNPEVDRYYRALWFACQMAAQSKDFPECRSDKYYELVNKIRSAYYGPRTIKNYLYVKELLAKKGIRFVCMQYPMRSIGPLKEMLGGDSDILFVDNEAVFKTAVQKSASTEYFRDMFGGDFGHCTHKGYGLLAENAAQTILKRYFSRDDLKGRVNAPFKGAEK